MNLFAPGNPQYFFDDTIIAHQQRLVRRWLPATIYPIPVIEPDKPWEGRMLALFGTVIEQADGYRLYYQNFTPAVEHARFLIATSEDGIRWHKPELGIIEWKGSRANNLLTPPDLHLDSPSVIFDPDDAAAPYKMIAFQSDEGGAQWNKPWGLYTYTSPDGLRWTRSQSPRLLAGDRTNVMPTKPDGKFVLYTRHPEMMTRLGARAIYRSESEDFENWSELELVLAPDLTDEPDVEYYGMSVFERHGWYFGLLEYWHGDTDTIEVHLAISRDGKNWTLPHPRRPFIAATRDWNRTWNSCASNGPIILNEQMVFYFGGRWVSHHYDSAQQYGAIGYASLPLDHFCAIEGSTGGVLITTPIKWPGGDLVLNADTRESFKSHPLHLSGEIAVEVLDAESTALPEWSDTNRGSFRGNTHSRSRIFEGRELWPGERSLNDLRGRTIRLRFHFVHSRLFTIEARH